MNCIQSTTAESSSLLVFKLYEICGAYGKSFTYYQIIKILLSPPPKVSSLSEYALVRTILKAHPYISMLIDSPDTSHWVRKTAKFS